MSYLFVDLLVLRNEGQQSVDLPVEQLILVQSLEVLVT